MLAIAKALDHRTPTQNPVAKRLRNVTPMQFGIGAAVAAVVGTGTYFVVRALRKPATTKPVTELDLPEEIHVRKGPSKKNNYVGSGWAWPHGNEFPKVADFGFTLATLGYEVGDWDAANWDVLSQRVMDAVAQYQSDYNIVLAATGDEYRLDTDGLLGTNTIEALLYSLNLQNTSPKDWQAYVAEAAAAVAAGAGEDVS